MLSTSAMMKTVVGTIRVKPFDAPRAVAQTASSTPDASRMIHDTTVLHRPVVSLSGYGVPRPGVRVGTQWSLGESNP